MTTIEDPAAPIQIPVRDEATIARGERIRLLLRSPGFIFGAILVGFWVVCALFGALIAPAGPAGRRHPQQARRAVGRPLLRD